MAILIYFDPVGMTVAAISATLLIVAIVYVVRDRAMPLDAPLTDAFTGYGFLLEPELFSSVIARPPITIGGFVISVGLHLAVALGTPLLPYLFPEEIRFDSRKYNVKLMELRVPAPLFYTAPEGPVKARPASRPSKAAARKALTPAERRARRAPAAAASPSAVAALNRPRLELPRSVRPTGKDVIIQPDQPPDIAMKLTPILPTAFLWALGPAPLDISLLVGAPQRPVPPTFSLPRATPKVQKPNREMTISDLEIAAAPVMTFRPPQLPAQAANVSPVGVIAPPAEPSGELPPTALPAGSPVNLIALMNQPAPPASGYLLEAGNRLAPSQPGDGAAANGSKAEERASKNTAGAAGNKGKDSESRAEVSRAAGEQGSARASAANTGAAGAKSSTSPTMTAAKGSHADLLTSTSAASDTAASGRGGAPASRSVVVGNLGVIVVQSSAQEAALEGSEVLTGQPVFTVYFDVPGAPRRWILQYCVPGSLSKSFEMTSDSVIRIVPKRSVQPPYPLDRIPLQLKGPVGTVKRLVVYAFVNERGETENIRMVHGSGQDEIDGTALATLRRWAFRPATRGDTPVAVEALFGIPLD